MKTSRVFETGGFGGIRVWGGGAKLKLGAPAPFHAALLASALLAPAPSAGATIDEIRELLRTRALEPIPETRLASLRESNLDWLLPQIDPHAALLPATAPPSRDAVEIDRLGADLYQRDGETWLLPYIGGPLAAAGIAQRAVLDAVDGQPVAGRSPDDIARLIAASPGRVRLDLWRVGAPGWETVEATLAPFRPMSVESYPVGAQRVIRIRSFVARETRSYLEDALKGFGATAPVVIDLRDCLGGDLYEALDAAGMFIPQGEPLASSRDRRGTRQYKAPGGDKFSQPLSLLTGPDTASAGEIFAGVLKERGRAKLIGVRTRGKCLSQLETRLADGSRFRFTNMAVLLPGDKECDRSGVDPHILVDSANLFDTAGLIERISAGR